MILNSLLSIDDKKNKLFNKANIIYVICILFASLAIAINRIYTSDYIPINGDFQNYNIFRRILSGQIPYKDFSNYLGIGVAILNIPFLIFNNNFTTSLFVTNFTTCLALCIIATVIIYFCTKNKIAAYIAGGLIAPTCVFINQITKLKWIFIFYNFYNPGASMRTQRAFLPIIFVLLMDLYLEKHNKINCLSEIIIEKRIIYFIVGFGIVWANDFGMACLVSLFCLFMFFNIYYNRLNIKKIVFKLLEFFVLVMLGWCLAATIFTLGHPKSYFDFTFGVSKYQFWYYGIDVSGKLLTLSDIIRNKYYMRCVIIFLLLTIVYIVKMLKNKLSDDELLLYYIYLSAFLSSAIYIYGSGGYSYEAFCLITFLICCGYIFNFIEYSLSRKGWKYTNRVLKFSLIAVLMLNTFWLTKQCNKLTKNKDMQLSYFQRFGKEHGLTLTKGKNAEYVEELKGYTQYKDSLEKAKKLVGNEKIFSTYSSALEVMLNQYNESGTDYIIHALGDEQRERYYNEFKNNNYKYASTIRPEYTDWESWIKRANWYFYRELYKNYAPIQKTDYSVIWQKQSSEQNIDIPVKVKYKKINDTTYEISAETESKKDIIADLSIKYSSSYVNNLYRMQTFKRIVAVTDESMSDENATDGFKNYFIPNESEEYKIPIFIYNGKGKIRISTAPQECTQLKLDEVKLNQVFYNSYNDLVKSIVASPLIDENWTLGVKNGEKILLLVNSERNRMLLKNSKKLKSSGEEFKIKSIEYKKKWIWIKFDSKKPIDCLAYPNRIEVINRELQN